MQRRAAAAYTALFVVVAVAAFATAATATPPDISIEADHELAQGQSVTLNGTTYNVTDLNGSAPSATVEWAAGNETQSATVDEGANVTLGGEQYVGHFEGETLQLTTDLEAYQDEVREQEAHDRLMHGLTVVATLSGITAVVLLAMAYLPTRRT